MIAIDRLNLELPPGFEDRASEITRLLADHLATNRIAFSQHHRQLDLPPLQIDRNWSDQRIAADLAHGIQQALAQGGRS